MLIHLLHESLETVYYTAKTTGPGGNGAIITEYETEDNNYFKLILCAWTLSV